MTSRNENGSTQPNGTHVDAFVKNTNLNGPNSPNNNNMEIDHMEGNVPNGKIRPGERGGEEYRARRLLTETVDYLAYTDPQRVYACVPNSDNLFDGFHDVTMATVAAAVNHMAAFIDEQLGPLQAKKDVNSTISFVGPSDLRYSILFLASIKCGRKMLFISPRNHESQNSSMLRRAGCGALLYADEMKQMVTKLGAAAPALHNVRVPSLGEILDASATAPAYPFTATYEDLQDETALILHSSGSTGDPKLVNLKHSTFTVTDNDTTMPVPEGRRAQNGAQFNFEPYGRYYSCFPAYHMAGVQAFIILPIFSKTATVVMGPPRTPPSGFLLAEIMKQKSLRAFYVPPFIIEQWASEPSAMEQAQGLDFILFGGGPLSPTIGNKLSEVADVCQMYGSLEIGQVQMLIPLPGQWEYLEPNPYEECDMQPMDDGLFELVLHQEPKFRNRRSVAHNFPDVKEWRTGDLFAPHPWKSGLWRFHSRIDDMVVLSSSHKLRPLEMETLIQGDVMVSGALIVGTGKPEPLLIVEPSRIVDMQKNVFINNIWPTIAQANAIAPTYGQINRSRIIISRPEAPFVRAPKGTVVRRLTEALYREEIDRNYSGEDDGIFDDGEVGSLERILINATKEYIRSVLARISPDLKLDDYDNFLLMGLDSLKATELGRRLRLGVSRRTQNNQDIISLRMIYLNPSINNLAEAIISAMFQSSNGPNVGEKRDIDKMRQIIGEFTTDLPQPRALSDNLPTEQEQQQMQQLQPPSSNTTSNDGRNVVLVGPRGRLGPHIVRHLLDDKDVTSVRCLNRGEDGRQRFRDMIADQGLKCDVDDPRLQFYAADIGRRNFGLTDAQAAETLNDAHVIIHNSWKVHFGWTLDSYKTDLIRSVRNLVDIAARADRTPRIVFVSSISSVQEWDSVFPSAPVIEEAVDSYDVTSPLGYGQSKHVSERILTVASEKSNLPVTILRLGQVAGPTSLTAGPSWSKDEWIPSLVQISKTLDMIPVDLGHIDWIPVDTMAEIIYDLSTNELKSTKKQPLKDQKLLKVYNLVNPNHTPFSDFVDILRSRIGPTAKEVSLVDWVQTLSKIDPKTVSNTETTVSMKILPFLQYLAEIMATGEALQPKFNTDKAVNASETMGEKLKGVDKGMMDLWCDQWGI